MIQLVANAWKPQSTGKQSRVKPVKKLSETCSNTMVRAEGLVVQSHTALGLISHQIASLLLHCPQGVRASFHLTHSNQHYVQWALLSYRVVAHSVESGFFAAGIMHSARQQTYMYSFIRHA